MAQPFRMRHLLNLPIALIYTRIYTKVMKKLKLFQNGKSQAVRLKKEDQFSGDEVFFQKVGDVGFIIDQENEWAALELGQFLLSTMPDLEELFQRVPKVNEKKKAD